MTALQASRKVPAPIKPATETFQIWKFIYTYSGIFIVYTLTTIFRKEALKILSPLFYVFWIAAVGFAIAYTLVRLRGKYFEAFLCTACGAICRHICLFFAFTGLYSYLEESSHPSMLDVWCQRILVQNCLLFYQGWTSIAAVIGFSSTLTYKFGMNKVVSSYLCLSLLMVLLLVWFILENFVFEKYTRFGLLHYVCIVVALSGVLARTMKEGSYTGFFGFVLTLLMIDIILLITRIVFIVYKEKKRADMYEYKYERENNEL